MLKSDINRFILGQYRQREFEAFSKTMFSQSQNPLKMKINTILITCCHFILHYMYFHEIQSQRKPLTGAFDKGYFRAYDHARAGV